MEITVRTESKFVTVPFSVVFNQAVRPAVLKLWCVLYAIAFTGQRCTMDRLCGELGSKHPRTIRLWLKELEDSKLISGWKRHGDLDEITVHTGCSSTDVYTLQSIRDALASGGSLDEVKRILDSAERNTDSTSRNLGSAERNTDSTKWNLGSAERNTDSTSRILDSTLPGTDGSTKPQNGGSKNLKNQESKNHEESVHPQEETPPDPAARWAAAVNTLQISMPRGDYETRLRGCELAQLVDDQAVIACPDLTTKTTMEDRYMSATRSALGVRVVRFVIKK